MFSLIFGLLVFSKEKREDRKGKERKKFMLLYIEHQQSSILEHSNYKVYEVIKNTSLFTVFVSSKLYPCIIDGL